RDRRTRRPPLLRRGPDQGTERAAVGQGQAAHPAVDPDQQTGRRPRRAECPALAGRVVSAPAPASHPSGVPQLRVVGDTGAEPGWNLDRPLALLACAGAPLQLTAEEADLVALTNAAGHYARRILDPDVEPDDVHPAEYIVEYLMAAHGLNRRTKGARVPAVESNLRRYLIPFFTELAFTRPEGKKGIAYRRLPQLETVPRMLAGDAPLPAATVAADQFR